MLWFHLEYIRMKMIRLHLSIGSCSSNTLHYMIYETLLLKVWNKTIFLMRDLSSDTPCSVIENWTNDKNTLTPNFQKKTTVHMVHSDQEPYPERQWGASLLWVNILHFSYIQVRQLTRETLISILMLKTILLNFHLHF